MIGILFQNLVILLSALLILWLLSIKIKDASIIDIFWGPACALPAVITFLRLEGASFRATLLTGLVSIWALRLAIYLGRRNLGHGEDYRYQKMRAHQKSDAAFAKWSLPYIFWMQGCVAWFISLPVQVGQFGGNTALGPLAFIGVIIFLAGLSFETIGDWQLQKFKSNADNAGKLMTEGLWSLTRHPNYFGDATVWAGLTLIALESSYGYLTILSPLVMAYFLINISGKSLTEKHMDRKYPEYAAYRARVSGFVPMPPKSNP